MNEVAELTELIEWLWAEKVLLWWEAIGELPERGLLV